MSDLKSKLIEMNASPEMVQWFSTMPLQTAWGTCERGDWMLKLACGLNMNCRVLVSAACDCAETVLKYVQDHKLTVFQPPTYAIKYAREWAKGKATVREAIYASSCTHNRRLFGTNALNPSDVDVATITASDYAIEACSQAAFRANGHYNKVDFSPATAADYAAKAAGVAAHTFKTGNADDSLAACLNAHKSNADLVRKRIPFSVIDVIVTPTRDKVRLERARNEFYRGNNDISWLHSIRFQWGECGKTLTIGDEYLLDRIIEMEGGLEMFEWAFREAIDAPGQLSLIAAWLSCERADWMMLLASELGIDRRLLILAAADCVEPTLKLLNDGESKDLAAEAIRVAREWVAGNIAGKDIYTAAYARERVIGSLYQHTQPDCEWTTADTAHRVAYAAYYVTEEEAGNKLYWHDHYSDLFRGIVWGAAKAAKLHSQENTEAFNEFLSANGIESADLTNRDSTNIRWLRSVAVFKIADKNNADLIRKRIPFNLFKEIAGQNRNFMAGNAEIFEKVTNELIRAMESNPQAWESGMTFLKSIPVNIENRPYRGLNVVRLCYEKYLKGFEHNKWITSRKIRFLKGSVKAGEEPSFILNSDAPYFTPSLVYNIDQVDNLPNQLYQNEYSWPIEQAGEKLYQSAECSIIDEHGPATKCPCYISAIDTIYQPPKNYFNSSENYYTTLAHEMVHSTLHESRLNRNPSKYHYAYEELIAEMGACFTCASVGIVGNLENHASYLESWIRALKKDKTLIFRAAKEAQTAANYLLFRVSKLDKAKP